MNVRELLMSEIWSKETSRKICTGFWITFALLVIYLGPYAFWVTPMERNAANTALKEIQALRQVQEADEVTYSKQLVVTEAAVEKCKAKRFTLQDAYLLWAVSEDFSFTSGMRQLPGEIKQKRAVLFEKDQIQNDEEIKRLLGTNKN